MSLTRRHFVGAAIGSGITLSGFSSPAFSSIRASDSLNEHWISAQGNANDSYSLTWVDIDGRQQSYRTGFRGHGVVQHPLKSTSVVIFSRRPGVIAVEVDLRSGNMRNRFHCEKDRHLLGHGCFSHDGRLLFTSEANYKTGEGKIVIRDSVHYKHLAEFSSYGIGPHEIGLLPDTKTLVIANGGILTHPDSGRKKLNFNSMVSTLTYIDSRSGEKVDEIRVAEPKASIRHLDITTTGSVVFSMQMQRNAVTHSKTIPLAGVHKLGESAILFNQAEAVIDQLKDYVGSVAVNNRSRIAGFTSPRGNVVAFWHIDSQQFVGYHRLHDVCGITVSDNQQYFVISSSSGQLRQLDAFTLKENKAKRLRLPNTHWDNHLIAAKI